MNGFYEVSLVWWPFHTQEWLRSVSLSNFSTMSCTQVMRVNENITRRWFFNQTPNSQMTIMRNVWQTKKGELLIEIFRVRRLNLWYVPVNVHKPKVLLKAVLTSLWSHIKTFLHNYPPWKKESDTGEAHQEINSILDDRSNVKSVNFLFLQWPMYVHGSHIP